MQLRLVRAERRKAAVLTPPKSRQFEASLRRDFDIQLNEFSDRKLRDISTALLIRLTYLLRILASVEGVVATAAELRSSPRLSTAVRIYQDERRRMLRHGVNLVPPSSRGRRSTKGLTRATDDDIRMAAPAIIWTTLRADILWLYANDVVADGKSVTRSNALQRKIKTYEQARRREVAQAKQRHQLDLVPRYDPRMSNGETPGHPITRASDS